MHLKSEEPQKIRSKPFLACPHCGAYAIIRRNEKGLRVRHDVLNTFGSHSYYYCGDCGASYNTSELDPILEALGTEGMGHGEE